MHPPNLKSSVFSNLAHQIVSHEKLLYMEYCFICFDDTEEYLVSSVCNCRHTALHPSCLEKWVETSGNLSCSVCNHPYKNLNIYHTMKFNKFKMLVFCISLCNTLYCFGGFLFCILYSAPIYHTTTLIFLGLCSITVLLTRLYSGLCENNIRFKWNHETFRIRHEELHIQQLL